MAYKLLLADDSITIQKVVEMTLSEEGFDVTAVGDGEEAFTIAGKLMPEIVLADVFMPKMDGYELCEKIKADPALKGIPVILLAGTFEVFDKEKAGRVGADDHLTKPFESAELIGKVKELVKRRGASAQAAPAAPSARPEATLAAEEVFEAEEVLEAGEGMAGSSDDLWSVVDMAAGDQPLADATMVLSEEEIWERANLASGPDSAAPAPAGPAHAPVEDEGLSWEELDAEPFEDDAGVEEALLADDAVEEALVAPEYEDAGDAGGLDAFPEVNLFEEPETPAAMASPVEPSIDMPDTSELPDAEDIMPFESLDEATSEIYEPAPAATAPAPAAPAQLSSELVEQKVREVLAGMSREMLEQIVWEVVPDLAEEMIRKEIQRLKTGH